jgi:hypothetical protein
VRRAEASRPEDGALDEAIDAWRRLGEVARASEIVIRVD